MVATAYAKRLIETAKTDPYEMFRTLPVGESGELWDFEQSPWVRPVFDWWLDDVVEWIFLLWASQTSKTTTMMGLALYAGKHDPDPAMWVSAMEDEADDFVIGRLKPFLEDADEDVNTGKKSEWRKRQLRLYGRMSFKLGYATSGPKLRSWPCRYIFGDEAGAWPAVLPKFGEPIEYTKKRTRKWTRKGRKGVYGTTPSTKDHPLHGHTAGSNFARWFVPCPDCGHFQFLSWDRIKFEHCRMKGGDWDMSKVMAETFYECEQCAARLTEKDKRLMVNNGVLQYVDADTGEPAERDKGNTSYTLHVPSTYSLFTSWGELARMFLRAKKAGPDSLRTFITDELAEPWEESIDRPDLDMIRGRIDESRVRGDVPDWALCLVVGMDVQKSEVFWEVLARGTEWRSAVVDCGMWARPPDGSLDYLDDLILAQYDGCDVLHTFIDSGYSTDEVYDLCTRHGPSIVSPCKGFTRDARDMVSHSNIGKAEHSKWPDWLKLYLVDTPRFRQKSHDSLKVDADGPNAFSLPADIPDQYLNHWLAWQREHKKVGVKQGIVWVQKERDDHYLDAHCYALATTYHPIVAAVLRSKKVTRQRPTMRKKRDRKTQVVKPAGRSSIRVRY